MPDREMSQESGTQLNYPPTPTNGSGVDGFNPLSRRSVKLHPITETTDKRTNAEKLTDYLLALANPSIEELADDDDLEQGLVHDPTFSKTVYEEGPGASRGCPYQYWEQRFNREAVRRKDLPRLLEDAKAAGVHIRTLSDEETQQSIKLHRRSASLGRTMETLVVWRTRDSTVFHACNPLVRQFFELGGYRGFRDVVTVDMSVRECSGLDSVHGNFRVGFELSLRWYDQAFDSKAYADKAGSVVYARSIPHVVFRGVEHIDPAVGISDNRSHTGNVTLRKGNDPPGVLCHTMSVQANFHHNSDLQSFPFEREKLRVILELVGGKDPVDIDHGRVLLPINAEMNLEYANPDWWFLNANAITQGCRGGVQKYILILNLQRRPWAYILHVVIFLFFLTGLSFAMSTRRSSDVEARVSVTLTFLLSSIGFKFWINFYLPRAAYLTILDAYVFSGVTTCAMLFLTSVFSVCPSLEAREEMDPVDREAADKQCRQAEDQNDNMHIAVACWWGLANVLMLLAVIRYVKSRVVTDKNLFRSAAHIDQTEQTSAFQRQKDKARNIFMRKNLFYAKSRRTLKARRQNALQAFREMELNEATLIQKINELRRAPWASASQLKSLERRRHLNISETPLLKTCSRSHERHTLSTADVSSDLFSLFLRANMRREATVLGPLLESAYLDANHLRKLYNEGVGSAAANALLEQAGIKEANLRVRLLAALGTKTVRVGTPVRYLALQGAARELWENTGLGTLNLDPRDPIPRSALLERIDMMLFGDGYDRSLQQLKVTTDQSTALDQDDDILRRYLTIVRKGGAFAAPSHARRPPLLKVATRCVRQCEKFVPEFSDVLEAVDHLGELSKIRGGGESIRLLRGNVRTTESVTSINSQADGSGEEDTTKQPTLLVGHAFIFPTGKDGPEPKRAAVFLASHTDETPETVKALRIIVERIRAESRATTLQMLADDLTHERVPYSEGSTLILEVGSSIVHVVFYPHKTRRLHRQQDHELTAEEVEQGSLSVFQNQFLTETEVWNMANCIMARLVLTSRRAGASVMVHAQRTFPSAATDFELNAETWVGFLATHDAISWPPGQYAIVLHIGRDLRAMGYCFPRCEEGEELRAQRLPAETPVRSVMNLMEQLVEHIDELSPCRCTDGDINESATDIMRAVCAEIKGTLTFAIAEANKDLQNRGFGPLDKENVAVFVYGTRALRTWRDQMETVHGVLASSALDGFEQVMSSFLQSDGDTGITERPLAKEIHVHFEILDASQNVDCERAAYIDAIKYGKGVPIELKDSIMNASSKVHMLGTVAWGAGSCRGKVGGRHFHADNTGLENIRAYLEEACAEEIGLAPSETHMVWKDRRIGGVVQKCLRFADVPSVVNRALSHFRKLLVHETPSLEYGCTMNKLSNTWPREERYLTEEFSNDPSELGLAYLTLENTLWRKPWAVRRWRKLQFSSVDGEAPVETPWGPTPEVVEETV